MKEEFFDSFKVDFNAEFDIIDVVGEHACAPGTEHAAHERVTHWLKIEYRRPVSPAFSVIPEPVEKNHQGLS